MGSLLLYIGTFITSTFFITLAEINDKKNVKRLFSIVGLLIPIIMFGLRYNVGADYESYINLYNKYCNATLNYLIFTRKFEIGFSLVMKIAYIFKCPQLIFIAFSTSTLIILYRNIANNKEKCSISLAWFLVLFLYSASTLNIIRQMLAVAIVMNSYKYVWERRPIRFFITVLLATMFHITALLFLPCYFINYKNNSKKQKILRMGIILIVLLIVIFFNNFMGILTGIDSFERYKGYTKNIESNNYKFLVKLLVLGAIIPFRKRLYQYNEKNKLYYFLLIIDVILYATGFISPFIKRITLYFGISEIFIISQIPRELKKQSEKNTTILVIIGYAISMFIITAYILGQSGIIPYQTIIGR